MAQNALMRAWRHRDKLREANRQTEWLSRIARNEALRECERRVPDPAEIEDEGEEDLRIDALVESSPIWTAFNSLTDEERELLHLRYEADMTQSAIADQLGIPEGTVKVRLYRAREKIRQGWEHEPQGDRCGPDG